MTAFHSSYLSLPSTNQSLIKVKRDNIVKARSVGGGHCQEKSVYDILKELGSATIKSESIILIFTLALMNKDIIMSADLLLWNEQFT